MTARLYTVHPVEGFRPKTFAGHRDYVIGAYFDSDGRTVSGPMANSRNSLISHLRADIHGQSRRCTLHLAQEAR